MLFSNIWTIIGNDFAYIWKNAPTKSELVRKVLIGLFMEEDNGAFNQLNKEPNQFVNAPNQNSCACLAKFQHQSGKLDNKKIQESSPFLKLFVSLSVNLLVEFSEM